MPDTKPAAATRRITAEEALGLQAFLGGDSTLDQFIIDNNLDRAEVDTALNEIGITVPDRGFGGKYTSDELSLYTDILEGDQDFFSASQTFGFDTDIALQGLQESGLRIPLQQPNREIFDQAFDLGLTNEQAANAIGVDPFASELTLRAAGLSLPGRKKRQTATQPTGSSYRAQSTGGSTGKSFLANAFSGIPQAPGVKLGFLKGLNRDEGNQNVFSGPRGVTESASIRKNKLSKGSE